MLWKIKEWFRENWISIGIISWMFLISWDITFNNFDIQKLKNYVNHLNDRINRIEFKES